MSRNIYTDHKKYIKAIQRWEQVPAMVTPKGMFVNGIPYAEWISHNPKPVYEVEIKPNPDGTHLQSGVVVPKKYNNR